MPTYSSKYQIVDFYMNRQFPRSSSLVQLYSNYRPIQIQNNSQLALILGNRRAREEISPPQLIQIQLIGRHITFHKLDDLVQLRMSNASNKLVQTRGQPGTHDMALARSFFRSLSIGCEVLIPAFDKSKFNGEGGITCSSVILPLAPGHAPAEYATHKH
jgi:hypothetical protein